MDNKRRKSSILKPQKNRNPLSDVDLGQEDSDDQTQTTNLTKSMRRVSFASNNFVKPFVADPEKNTIWDQTYEESIEKSDSSQSNKENDRDALNITTIEDDDCELDLTPTVDVIKCNIIPDIRQQTQNEINDMDFTRAADICGSIQIENIQTDIDMEMEYTTPISNFTGKTVENPVNLDVSMDVTETIPAIISEKLQNVSAISENLLFQPESLYGNTLYTTSTDDTEHLINYNLSAKKKSDFSKVISGDSVASFPDLITLPLRGINSISFVQDCLKDDERDISANCENIGCTKLLDTDMEQSNVDNKQTCGDMDFNKENPKIVIHTSEKNSKSADKSALNIHKNQLPKIVIHTKKSEIRHKEIGAGDEPELFIKKITTSTVTEITKDYWIDDTKTRYQTEKKQRMCAEDNQANEDNSILQLCTRISEQGTCFIGNISDTSVLENQASEVVLETQRSPLHTQTTDLDKDIKELMLSLTQLKTETPRRPFLDRLVPINMQIMDNLVATSRAREEYVKEKCEKMRSTLRECNEFYQKKLEEHRKEEEFFKLLEEARSKYLNKSTLNDENAVAMSDNEVVEDNCDTSTVEIEILHWEDKIRKLYERSDGYWKIMSLDENPYKFNTLFETIELTVKVNEENGQVINIDLEDQISDESEPIALYMHKIFIDKLTFISIQSALGKKFDILSLLDYVKITMENILKIDTDYTYLSTTHAVCMSRDYEITFMIVSVKLTFAWEFTIDVSNYDNINATSVSYGTKVGRLRDSDIQKCMQDCPKGFAFVKAFVKALYNLLERLEKVHH